MKWTGRKRIGIAAGVAAASVAFTAAASVSVVILSSPDGRPSFSSVDHVPGDMDAASPVAVSADGAVVVANGVSGSGPEAFRWTAATGAVGLGDLPGILDSSEATHAAHDGSVIVGRSSSSAGSAPFRWTAAHGLEPILPDATAVDCVPTALTPDASTVVLACTQLELAPFPTGACNLVWSEARGLERLASGPRYVDVADDGAVLVGVSDVGVVRRERGGDGSFGTGDDAEVVVVPGAFFLFLGDPSASSDARTIVVPQTGIFPDLTTTIRWSAGGDGLAGTPDDVTQQIGARGNGTRCEALGLSDDGTTAVGRCTSSGVPYPARWTARTGWTRLVTTPPPNATGGAATVSSSDGRVVAGWMQDGSASPRGSNRQIRTFRWTVAGGASFFPRPGRETVGRERVAMSGGGEAVLGPEWIDRGAGLLLWQAGRGRRHIDDLPDGPSRFEPQGLSADGTRVVGTLRSSAGHRVVPWSPPFAPSAIGPASQATWQTHSSSAGDVVVAGYPVDRSPGFEDASAAPFRWRASSGAASTLKLPKPFPGCWVERLSKGGSALAGSCRSAARYWSFFNGAGIGTLKAPGTGLGERINCEIVALSANGARAALRCAASPTTGEIVLWTPANGRTRKVVLGVAGDPTLVALSDDGRRMLVSVKSGGADPLWLLWTESVGAELLPIPVDATWIRGLRLSADGSTVLLRTATEHLRYRSGLGLEVVPRPIGSALQPDSVAFLSADGRVVAGFDPMPPGSDEDPIPPPPRVWVSDPLHGGRWLDEIITSQTGEDLGGWELERLVGMSDDGTRFAGTDADATGWLGAWHVVVPDLSPQ